MADLSLAWVEYIKSVCAEADLDEPAEDVLGDVIGHFQTLGFETPKSAARTPLEDLKLDEIEMTPKAKELIRQLCLRFAEQGEQPAQSTSSSYAQVPTYTTIPTSYVVAPASTTVVRSISPSRVVRAASPTYRYVAAPITSVVAAAPTTVVRQRSISPSRLVQVASPTYVAAPTSSVVAAAPTTVVRLRSISPSRVVQVAAAPTTVVRQRSISASRVVQVASPTYVAAPTSSVVAAAPTTVVRQRSISPSRVVQVASPTYVAAAPTYAASCTYAAASTTIVPTQSW
jgi:hypothetical protein